MNTYLILQNPGHNRVYYEAAGKLALAELTLATEKMEASCSEIKSIEIAGVRYLQFITENLLSEKDLQIISRLSFLYALYELKEIDNQQSLVPIPLYAFKYVDDKISTVLKYPGKTNELFTRMMINVAALSSSFGYDESIRLLDPVAGKGTTLFEASIYGFNAFGVELETKSVHDTSLFFKKYLQTERYKNHFEKRQVAGKKKSEATYMDEFSYNRTKEEFKNEEQHKKLGIINGPSQYTDQYFKKNSIHLIVGDLPYGVAHGNIGKKNAGSRNPSELIAECLPAWKAVLKPGGIIVLAWNTFLVSPKRLADIFSDAGLVVLNNEPYQQFEHMVDKSIKRNIIVVKKV